MGQRNVEDWLDFVRSDRAEEWGGASEGMQKPQLNSKRPTYENIYPSNRNMCSPKDVYSQACSNSGLSICLKVHAFWDVATETERTGGGVAPRESGGVFVVSLRKDSRKRGQDFVGHELR